METPTTDLILRPHEPGDAEILFPLVDGTAVTDTLVWDGPQSLAEFRQALDERGARTRRGELHTFTIVQGASGRPIGLCSVRPVPGSQRADIGLWIGEPYQGRGYGTRVIALLSEYGFEKLGMDRMEGEVFVGNQASRRIFEKNGYVLERTIPAALVKRGVTIDNWLFVRDKKMG